MDFVEERVVELDAGKALRDEACPVVEAEPVIHVLVRQQGDYSGLQCLGDSLVALLRDEVSSNRVCICILIYVCVCVGSTQRPGRAPDLVQRHKGVEPGHQSDSLLGGSVPL